MNVIKCDAANSKSVPTNYTGKVEWYIHSKSQKVSDILYRTEYFQNGKLHRIDGQAVKYHNGYTKIFLFDEEEDTYWYLNGIKYATFDLYFDALLNKSSDNERDKILFNLDVLKNND